MDVSISIITQFRILKCFQLANLWLIWQIFRHNFCHISQISFKFWSWYKTNKLRQNHILNRSLRDLWIVQWSCMHCDSAKLETPCSNEDLAFRLSRRSRDYAVFNRQFFSPSPILYSLFILIVRFNFYTDSQAFRLGSGIIMIYEDVRND